MARPRSVAAIAAAALLLSIGLTAQAPPYRSGVDVVLVDLTVLDRKDAPVPDLGPGDVALRVDGQPRPIRSLTYLPASRDVAAADPLAPPVPSDIELRRTIVVVVDRESIAGGQGQPALAAAAHFVDHVPATDRLAFATLPEPGEHLDFGEPRADLKKRLSKAVGTWWPAPAAHTLFPWEAFEIVERNEETLARVAARECAGSDTNPGQSATCRDQLRTEAGIVAESRRRDVEAGLQALRHLCAALGTMEGPKHVVLLAGGLPDAPASLLSVGSLARDASANRVRVHVLQVVPNADWSAPGHRGPSSRPAFTPSSTAAVNLATATGGLAFAPVSAEAFVKRLETQLAGAYLLAFDPIPSDRDGRPHPIEVRVAGREGVRVLARREFIVPPGLVTTAAAPVSAGSPTMPPAQAVGVAAEAPSGAAGAPAVIARAEAPALRPTLPPSAAPRPSGDPAVDAAVRRLSDYVAGYGANAALFVAAERYEQHIEIDGQMLRPRSLTSEFAIVRTRDAIGWAGYRDVVLADGKQVVDRKDRLQATLTGTADPGVEVKRIVDESARFNVGPVMRNFNLPTTALFFFHPSRIGRFAFTSRGTKTVEGARVIVLDFSEVVRPTLIMKRNGTDVPAEGSVWVVPEDGTIVRTRVRLRGFADMYSAAPSVGGFDSPITRIVGVSVDSQPGYTPSSPGASGAQSPQSPTPAPAGGSGGTGGSGSSAGAGPATSPAPGTSGPPSTAPSSATPGEATSSPTPGATRVVRLESRADIEVTYRLDPRFGVWLPVKMSELYEGPIPHGTAAPLNGIARAVAQYSDFRRFETSATLLAPK